jgi:hypothetical protein
VYNSIPPNDHLTNFLHSILNRMQDVLREDVRIVGGEEWQEKVYNRKEW